MTVQVADRLQLAAIFATLYIHGNYIPYTTSDGRFQIGSVARINTFLDETRRELWEENVLHVDGGDSPYNTTLANITLGDVSVAALSALGLDATVLGNHDFDYFFENLLFLAGEARYAMLSANIRYKADHAPVDDPGLPFGDYVIKEAAGIRINIFGITDDESTATTLYVNTVDITLDDDLEKTGEVVATLIHHTFDAIGTHGKAEKAGIPGLPVVIEIGKAEVLVEVSNDNRLDHPVLEVRVGEKTLKIWTEE